MSPFWLDASTWETGRRPRPLRRLTTGICALQETDIETARIYAPDRSRFTELFRAQRSYPEGFPGGRGHPTPTTPTGVEAAPAGRWQGLLPCQ